MPMEDRLAYILENFRIFYQYNDLKIDYDQEGKSPLLIRNSVPDSFFTEKKNIDAQKVVWKIWKDVRIPFLFDQSDDTEIISERGKRVYINYDIIASAFYFLSGWDEYVNAGKDELGRIAYEDTLIHRLGTAGIPVVNYYFDILATAIDRITNIRQRTIWGESDFGVALTHDIDTCQSAWLEGSFSELKKFSLFSIPWLLFQRMIGRDAWFNFRDITDIESGFRAKSSFYFLPRKGKVQNLSNADYKISARAIRQKIKELEIQGNEIGVHGSFGTHTDGDMLRADIKNIPGDPVRGNRFHFLMFDLLKTVTILEKNNVSYDTTLGFAEQPGFRRGTCYPFYLYNFDEMRISPVVELPLIVMDTSLQHKKYLGLSPKDSLSVIFKLIDEVIKFKGLITLLWHNTYFSKYKYDGWRDVYIKMLDYCQTNKAFMDSGIDAYQRIFSDLEKT